jgi:plastocyanin
MLGRDVNQLPLSPRTRRLLPMLALPMVLFAGACGGESANAGPSATDGRGETDHVDAAFEDLTGRDDVVIQVRDNSFVGQHVTVSAGTTVTFDNRGRNPHNAVPVEDDAFAEVPTESLQPGQAATVVFDGPGEYPYYCTLHGTETAGMVGTIRVVD